LTIAASISGDALDGGEIGAHDLDTDRRADAGRQHVEPALDGHGPGVGDAGQLQRLVHLASSSAPADPVAPEGAQQALSHSGAQDEYQRGFARHSDSGLSR
jgi:hypothetical protein